jgi:hypothetical protein
MLVFGHGMVALTVPAARAGRVANHLGRFSAGGPVLAVDGERPYWVFLADTNAYITMDADLPAEVDFLGCWQRRLVPGPKTNSADLRCIVAPDPRQRWLPTLATLALAVRLGLSPAVRP